MAVVAGDLLEITVNHPILGDFSFDAKAAEDTTIDRGGFRVNDDASMVGGSGANIKQMNRVRWSLEATILNDTQIKLDAENINALSNSPLDATWTFAWISGTILKGEGTPVGDVQANGNAGTMTLKVAGGGKLEKI